VSAAVAERNKEGDTTYGIKKRNNNNTKAKHIAIDCSSSGSSWLSSRGASVVHPNVLSLAMLLDRVVLSFYYKHVHTHL
jgi:hypothetical protein